jgi:hypothetical protein
MTSNKLSRIVLRIHGGIFLVMMPSLIILSTIGLISGTGLFAFLHATPLADVGLLQLYAVMTVLGIVLIIGSFQSKTWTWNLIGIITEITPLLSNYIFAGIYKKTGIAPSWTLHSILILLEFLSLLTLFYEYHHKKICSAS